MTVLIIVIAILVVCFFYWQDTALQVTHHTIHTSKDTSLKIAHLSDIHNTELSELTASLLRQVKLNEPDIIVITGDLIDRRFTDIPNALNLVRSLCQIAPVYYIMGNHEAWCDDYPQLEAGLKENHVIILRNDTVDFNDDYEIIGLENPPYNEPDLRKVLDSLTINNDKYSIMLSHRPEWFDIYQQYPVDLILSGHCHGGQIRLPFLGGLFAPNQGILPKLTAGLHSANGTDMIISRGIGNSAFPFRVFNRPQLIIINLEK